jgi:hypothetical protein
VIIRIGTIRIRIRSEALPWMRYSNGDTIVKVLSINIIILGNNVIKVFRASAGMTAKPRDLQMASVNTTPYCNNTNTTAQYYIYILTLHRYIYLPYIGVYICTRYITSQCTPGESALGPPAYLSTVRPLLNLLPIQAHRRQQGTDAASSPSGQGTAPT